MQKQGKFIGRIGKGRNVMGYVLPVQMDAYTQYANRTVSEKQRIKLDPVFRPAFYKVDPQQSWEEIHRNLQHNQVNRKKEKAGF